jgi:hypothetical protein
LAISLRPGITRNPEHLLGGTSLGFECKKEDKYISGDERGGFKVAKVSLPLPDGRLRLFLKGKKISGHHWRIRCEKYAKYHSHPNQCKQNG